MKTWPDYLLHRFWGAIRVLREIEAGQKLPEILEVGCGVGITSRYIAERFPASRITAIDLDTEKINEARAVQSQPKVVFLEADATKLTYPDESFDVCFSFLTFHHMPNFRTALEEIWRVLKASGKLYIFDISGREVNPIHPLAPWWPSADMARFTKAEFESALAKAGFQIERSEGKRIFRIIARKETSLR